MSKLFKQNMQFYFNNKMKNCIKLNHQSTPLLKTTTIYPHQNTLIKTNHFVYIFVDLIQIKKKSDEHY